MCYIYLYNASGIAGIINDEVPYYFKKNILGDVEEIYNYDGNLVNYYVYDAWGNHKVYTSSGAEDTNQNSIGNLNPFIYKLRTSKTNQKTYKSTAKQYKMILRIE